MSRRGQSGQAMPIALLVAGAIVCGGVGMFTLGRAHAAKSQAQTAADLAAVSAGRRVRQLLPAMVSASRPERATLRADVGGVAARIARANGTRLVRVVWPDGDRWPPVRVQVTVTAEGPFGTTIPASARAALAPGAGGLPDEATGIGGGYRGPLVTRDDKPMCPAVAQAFDLMDAAARREGVNLVVNSGYRSDAEQAVLFARHPDPRWVAPPGRSRHRDATELDIAGTPGAWDWLASAARRFGFVQRYAWEPWHYGFLPGCDEPTGSRSGTAGAVDAAGGGLPAWVPPAYREAVMSAAVIGGVPPTVLAALLQAESGFNRRAVSTAGAQGIAQFMPATARGVGLDDPFDPAQAIPAAARLLGSHIRTFGQLPAALAAYNAGPGAVRRYGGIPPYPETRAYVARIMALAGDPTMAPSQTSGDPVGGVALERIGGLLV